MSLPPLRRNKALEQACGFDALHYGEALAYGQQCYEQALLDAMNATRAFGKTGEVIAVIIAALRTKPSLTCAKCGVDRMRDACKQPGPTCPFMGETQ
jgi:hypothetical protein